MKQLHILSNQIDRFFETLVKPLYYYRVVFVLGLKIKEQTDDILQYFNKGLLETKSLISDQDSFFHMNLVTILTQTETNCNTHSYNRGSLKATI